MNVAAFLTQLAVDSALLFAFSIPLILVARRRGRNKQARNFLIAAAIIALSTTIILTTSDRLVEMCHDAGSSRCEDIGSTAFRMILIGGYIIVALIEAYLITRD